MSHLFSLFRLIVSFSDGLRIFFFLLSFFILFSISYSFRSFNRRFSIVIQIVSVLYIGLLLFIAFHDNMTVRRWILGFNAGLPIQTERNYAMNCGLSFSQGFKSFVPLLLEKVDVFIVAHLMGWTVKAIIIRDAGLLWTLSFLFEWLEVTFRHILPNFWECWWDHFLLDLFGCNWLGMVIGFKVINYFGMERYKWYWKSEKQQNVFLGKGKATQCIQSKLKGCQNFPKEFALTRSERKVPVMERIQTWRIQYLHSMFSSFKSYLTLVFFIVIATAADVNVFFLKAQLGLSPSHWIVLLRTAFVAFAAMEGTHDVYSFVTSQSQRVLGLQAFLNIAIVLVEFLVIVRFWNVLPLHHPMPHFIQRIWMVIGFLLCLIPLVLFGTTNLRHLFPDSEIQRRDVTVDDHLHKSYPPHDFGRKYARTKHSLETT